MRVDITPLQGNNTGKFDIRLNNNHILPKLTEHDLGDIAFALAQRTAMSRRCTATRGEHTCALAPGHDEPGSNLLRLQDTPDGWRTVPGFTSAGGAHQCRACTERWEGPA